jgi:hypothetical protein
VVEDLPEESLDERIKKLRMSIQKIDKLMQELSGEIPPKRT